MGDSIQHKDVYDYNLSEVLDGQQMWEDNKDCDNDDEDMVPPSLAHPPKKPKSKTKPKSTTNKKHKKKANNDDNNSKYSHGNYDSDKPYVYHVDYYEVTNPMTKFQWIYLKVLSPKRCQSVCRQSMKHCLS